jgi:PIN domain nuclease of toxin-antitoxin system
MRLLLDTQIAVWWQIDSRSVPAAARKLVLETEGPVYLSRGSLWELAIKASIGRLKLDLPKFCERVAEDGFQWLDISQEHLLAVARLPPQDEHKDPFDRLLVAQSLTEPLILLTADSKLARYGSTVRVV